MRRPQCCPQQSSSHTLIFNDIVRIQFPNKGFQGDWVCMGNYTRFLERMFLNSIVSVASLAGEFNRPTKCWIVWVSNVTAQFLQAIHLINKWITKSIRLHVLRIREGVGHQNAYAAQHTVWMWPFVCSDKTSCELAVVLLLLSKAFMWGLKPYQLATSHGPLSHINQCQIAEMAMEFNDNAEKLSHIFRSFLFVPSLLWTRS